MTDCFQSFSKTFLPQFKTADGTIVPKHTLRFTMIYTYVHKHFFCHLSFFDPNRLNLKHMLSQTSTFPWIFWRLQKKCPVSLIWKLKNLSLNSPTLHQWSTFLFCNGPDLVTNSSTPCSSYKDSQVIFRAGGLNYNRLGVQLKKKKANKQKQLLGESVCFLSRFSKESYLLANAIVSLA